MIFCWLRWRAVSGQAWAARRSSDGRGPRGPIKIGMPAALSGAYAQYGIQARRAAELFSKDIKAKGMLGRPVEFIYEDTAGDPATAVRKAQKLVEKDGVKFLTGVALSSEALAVSAKCPEWKVIFMSTINGAGALTTKSFHRYFFRVNTSGPMGARAISLYLAEAPMKRFFALGSDYAWGRDSVDSFVTQIKGARKDVVGTDYPPVGTKDFASYIAKIRQSKAEGVYLALPGQDATIYLKQAHQFGLNQEVKPIMEILELENMKAVGDAMVGPSAARATPSRWTRRATASSSSASTTCTACIPICSTARRTRASSGWARSSPRPAPTTWKR